MTIDRTGLGDLYADDASSGSADNTQSSALAPTINQTWSRQIGVPPMTPGIGNSQVGLPPVCFDTTQNQNQMSQASMMQMQAYLIAQIRATYNPQQAYNPYQTNPYQQAYNPYQTNPYQQAYNPYQTNPYQQAYNPYQTNPYQQAYNPYQTNPYQQAYNPYQTNPYQQAYNPYQTAYNPYQAAYNPYQTAYNPYQAAYNPYQSSVNINASGGGDFFSTAAQGLGLLGGLAGIYSSIQGPISQQAYQQQALQDSYSIQQQSIAAQLQASQLNANVETAQIQAQEKAQLQQQKLSYLSTIAQTGQTNGYSGSGSVYNNGMQGQTANNWRQNWMQRLQSQGSNPAGSSTTGNSGMVALRSVMRMHHG